MKTHTKKGKPAMHLRVGTDWADYGIFPYELEDGRIVFDDPAFRLVEEELTAGVDTFLRKYGVPGCGVFFSTRWMHCAYQLERQGEDSNGWQIYRELFTGAVMKFCPNFRLYYPDLPRILLVNIKNPVERGAWGQQEHPSAKG